MQSVYSQLQHIDTISGLPNLERFGKGGKLRKLLFITLLQICFETMQAIVWSNETAEIHGNRAFFVSDSI